MNRLMKPERLDLDPSAPNAAKEWRHWRRTFDNIIIECGIDPVPNKHRIITNLMSAIMSMNMLKTVLIFNLLLIPYIIYL